MNNFTQDRFINQVSIEGLVEAILDRFRVVMQRNDVKISIRIVRADGKEEVRDRVRAASYLGTRLPEVTIENPDGGRTVFRLYLAKRVKGLKRGRINVGELDNDFRFPASLLVRSVGELLPEEVGQALKSGIFEGDILSERCVLRPERQGFEKGDAQVGFCLAIEEWYRTVGASHLELARENREEVRYQQLGIHTMTRLEALLRDDKFAEFRKVIASAKLGTVGTGHAEPKKKVVGEQEQTAIATRGRHQPVENVTDRKVEPEPKDPQERPEHLPLTVQGPKGQVRRLVKSNSLGLQFVHDQMKSDSRLWYFEPEIGLLHFNIRHPLWESCSHSDKAILRLQEFIAAQALALAATPEEWEAHNRLFSDTAVPLHIFFIISEQAKPGKKAKA